jgi:hypothetical protein
MGYQLLNIAWFLWPLQRRLFFIKASDVQPNAGPLTVELQWLAAIFFLLEFCTELTHHLKDILLVACSQVPCTQRLHSRSRLYHPDFNLVPQQRAKFGSSADPPLVMLLRFPITTAIPLFQDLVEDIAVNPLEILSRFSNF